MDDKTFKKCKICGETNIDRLFFIIKNKNKIIYNICGTCRSKNLKEKNLGKKLSESTKQKLREINLGKKQSQETIDKRRVKLRIPCSEEKKAKLRISIKGFKHTKETKEKISEIQKGRKQSPETIKKRVQKIIGIKHPPRPKGFSERMSETMIKAMNNPITKEKNRKHFYYCLQKTSLGKPTDIEQKIINLLIKHNIYFLRHFFIKNIKHGFAADFFIPDKNIVIEADGDFWHNYPHGNEIDHIRTKELIEKDYIVLRFWGSEIHNNIKQVEQKIINKVRYNNMKTIKEMIEVNT